MLSKEQQEQRTAEEAEYWFKETMAARAVIEQQAAVIRAHCATHAEDQTRKETALKTIADLSDRLNAVTAFYTTARKTGYWSDWSIGGVGVDCLEEERRKAINYRPPQVYRPEDLIEVGGVFTESRADYQEGQGFIGDAPMYISYAPVYRLKGSAAHERRPTKRTKKSG